MLAAHESVLRYGFHTHHRRVDYGQKQRRDLYCAAFFTLAVSMEAHLHCSSTFTIGLTDWITVLVISPCVLITFTLSNCSLPQHQTFTPGVKGHM